jgi:signal transduction histidine kinase
MPRRSPIDRALVRLLARSRGSARAIHDVHYVRELLRFAGLFGSLVLAPVALLAVFALQSLEGEEIRGDAALASRADAIATLVHRELRQTLDGFAERARRRLDDGEAGVRALHAAEPALRGVFRFDAEGRLVAPFAAEDAPFPAATPRWERLAISARRAETQERLDEAQRGWEQAAEAATAEAHRAVGELGLARVGLARGDPDALARLERLPTRYPRERTSQGFRVADVAWLHVAETARATGQAGRATEVMRALVERALAGPWSLAYPQDVAVGRRALDALQGLVEPRWWRAADQALTQRTARLLWASRADDELRLVAGRTHRDEELQFHAEERALWASVLTGGSLHVFGLDYDAVRAGLERTVLDLANRVDPELTAGLVRADEALGTAIVRRSLAPELPLLAVVVRARDPDALAAARQQSRRSRQLVIGVAVLAALLGMVATVRLVNRELENARVKADFAANVSHELRSPITQIRLKAEALQLDLVRDEEDRAAHHDAIVREAERLSRLVDNVLDFASIERGVKKYTLRADDVLSVALKALDAADHAAREVGVRLEADLPDDLPPVWIDREAMGQVLTNLLSNAIKYGAQGEWVTLAAGHEPGHVWLEVRDRGIGIAAQDLGRVFEHFYRVPTADVRRRRGTGIGLTIVRYIVEAHGGTISVVSQLGQGSTFRVELPDTPPPDVAS